MSLQVMRSFVPKTTCTTLPRPAMPIAPARPRAPLALVRPLPARPPSPPVQDVLPRDISSRFGRRIRQLREERALTQIEVAVHFGIDRTFISDVERGRKGVCLPTLEVFALGFGLSMSELLRGV